MVEVKPGDYVAWKWINGIAEGVVEEVCFERKIILSKGKTIVRVGSDDNPALVINHKSGNKVIKLLSEVQITEKST
jgi:hypothetical protein